MAVKYREGALVATKISFNGEVDMARIEKEMVRMWSYVGTSYKAKKNRSITVVQGALKDANRIVHREVLLRAPVIRPDLHARQSEDLQGVHLNSPKYCIEGSRGGKKWINSGIIARRVVTFKGEARHYAAAVEFGRDEEFMQVVRKAPYGITGGQTDYFLRTVKPMKAQPFLLPALSAKSGQAVNVFASSLQKRWLTVLKRVYKQTGKTV